MLQGVVKRCSVLYHIPMGNKTTKKPVPLGVEFFETVSEECYYVDKTGLIETIASYPEGTCLLFTRPRRFGKTLMLSTLQCFFEAKETDNSQYFIGKQVWENRSVVANHFQEYPVIHLNLQNVIGLDFGSLVDKLKECMRQEYERHSPILSSPLLNEDEKRYYRQILEKKSSLSDVSSSLFRLSGFLYKAHKKKVVILIDEYDSPVHYAFDYGFYDQAIMLFKQFYGESLKTNPSVHLAVLTGILQIAKESLFSGVNNLVTNSVLSKNMDEGFGFSEEEVKKMLDYYGLSSGYELVSEWYGGYRFGDSTIFNPLSVLSFVQNGGESGCYWNNTGESKTLGALLSLDCLDSLLPLLSGKDIQSEVDIALSYKDLDGSFASICSYLLASGYLSIAGNYEEFYDLVIPNKEIKQVFKKEIRARYMKLGQVSLAIKLKKAFEEGKSEEVEELFEKYLLSTFSSYEMGEEKNYQVLLSSVLAVTFDDAYVKNEFNAGTGRADVVVCPNKRDALGFVIEVKNLKSRTTKERLERSAADAIKQIETRFYDQDLRRMGVKRILLFGVSFHKNQIAVQCKKKTIA